MTAKQEIQFRLLVAVADATFYLSYYKQEIKFDELKRQIHINNQNLPNYDSDWMEEWVENHRDEPTDYVKSSGSFFTALTDFDNLIPENLQQDEDAWDLYHHYIQPIRMEVYNS